MCPYRLAIALRHTDSPPNARTKSSRWDASTTRRNTCAARVTHKSIELIFAIVKRQVYGTHHRMNPQFLPLYLFEVSYPFNYRNDPNLFWLLRNGLLLAKQLAAS